MNVHNTCLIAFNRSKELIKSGILDNDFLRHLDPQRVKEVNILPCFDFYI